MPVFAYQREHRLAVVSHFAAQVFVVERTELGYDAVNHAWREYFVLLKGIALTLEGIGRGHA